MPGGVLGAGGRKIRIFEILLSKKHMVMGKNNYSVE